MNIDQAITMLDTILFEDVRSNCPERIRAISMAKSALLRVEGLRAIGGTISKVPLFGEIVGEQE